MLLLIDNYDSFTYNLYQYLSELGAEVVVRRNDEITLAEIEALAPTRHRAFRPDPARPTRRASATRSFRRWGSASQPWASAWGISVSARSLAA